MIVDAPAEAAWNMAVDEALLQRAAGPTLRLYGWSPHAVSLGYFQKWADFADLAATTPIVRRLTGGGAIHHGDEVTFTLVVDATLLPNDVAASYSLLHDAAIAALADVDVTATRHPAGPLAGARPTERWCFALPGRDDVVTPAGKLLGSAQRRVRTPRPRVLHHGSLVLRRPNLTPFVAAIEDSTRCDGDLVPRLHRALTTRIGKALQLEPERGDLADDERSLAAELSVTRYRDPTFLRRC